LQALTTILEQLPVTLPACVLVVVHSSAKRRWLLPRILDRVSALPVSVARDGDPLKPGHVYIAPNDSHLLVGATGLQTVHGPRENGFRPAIDPLFRTAARAFGVRVIGVILSGALSDGTYGLSLVKHHGGVAVVQDPDDAIVPGMPESAIAHVEVDHVLPATAIATALGRLTRSRGEDQSEEVMAPVNANDLEPPRPSDETELSDMVKLFGPPSGLTCPDCGGALWEIQEGRAVRYRCPVGHQYADEIRPSRKRPARTKPPARRASKR
jgi:two-component system chemotaxis response regulator CheB